VLPLWRSISSLNLMLPKEERKAMLLRLYNDHSELIDHNKERNMKPGGAKVDESADALTSGDKSKVESTETEDINGAKADDADGANAPDVDMSET
jgi:multisite-specific tRNA:(cytosine-C5)-methyltransferase